MQSLLLQLIAILILCGCSTLESLQSNFSSTLLQSKEETYTVQSGDSIWSIALEYNLNPDIIIKGNNLLKPFTIFPGQKLYLDGSSSSKSILRSQEVITWHNPININNEPISEGSYWLVYNSKTGNPIFSIQEGKVVVSGPDIPGYGNLVMISHPDGYLSLYAHCDQVYVSQGDQVLKGTLIANLGNSEAAYPMLRFQLRKNGKPVQASKINF